MELGDITLFNVIKKRLSWLGQRQEIVAQNIANADTPDFKSKDLKPFNFGDLVRREASLNMVATQNNHMPGRRKRAVDFAVAEERKPYETNPDGNSVVLEEQMSKMNETQVSHRLTNELYKKHLKMIRTALGSGR